MSALGLAVVGPEAARRPQAARGALTAQLRAAAKSAHRVAVQRLELSERHSAPECSAVCRDAAAHLRLRAPETGLDSVALRRRAVAWHPAARRRVEWVLPKVLVLRPLAVRTAAALESALLQAGWAAPEAIVWRPAAVREMARFSAEFAVRARHLAGPVVSAWQAAALPLEELAASGALEAPQQAERDAAEVPQQEVAVWDVAEAAREVAARDEAAAPQPAVAWVGAAALPPEAVRQQEARGAAAVPLRGAALRAVPDARVVEPRAAHPSAVLWVFRRDQALPWPAPQPAVRFARALPCLRIALP